MLIKSITAKQIKNSRKQLTIQVTVKTSKTTATASAPSGASTGKREIKIFPKGIKYAINQIKKLKNIEINNFNELKKIEKLTKKIGANPTIALEFAIIKALAKENKLPLFKYLNKKAKNSSNTFRKLCRRRSSFQRKVNRYTRIFNPISK